MMVKRRLVITLTHDEAHSSVPLVHEMLISHAYHIQALEEDGRLPQSGTQKFTDVGEISWVADDAVPADDA